MKAWKWYKMIHILTQHIEERYLFIVDIKVREITDNDKNLSNP